MLELVRICRSQTLRLRPSSDLSSGRPGPQCSRRARAAGCDWLRLMLVTVTSQSRRRSCPPAGQAAAAVGPGQAAAGPPGSSAPDYDHCQPEWHRDRDRPAASLRQIIPSPSHSPQLDSDSRGRPAAGIMMPPDCGASHFPANLNSTSSWA
jgi:hypothetical protein